MLPTIYSSLQTMNGVIVSHVCVLGTGSDVETELLYLEYKAISGSKGRGRGRSTATLAVHV